MSWHHPLFLFGLALALLPVLLHFIMRARPKKLIFPALQLIQIRRKTNARRMRLRHIWLMLLRMAAIAFLVLALARPTLPAADYSPTLLETVTLLGIIAVTIAAYFGVMHIWQRNRLPQHQLLYRRTLLRGGLGLAGVVLALLLFAWPYQRRIAAEYKAPLPNVAEELPVSAVFLFDSSASMEYTLEGETRLNVAQQIATEHLSTLPPNSRVAVADSASDLPVLFQADRIGAQSRIDELETHAVSRPLSDRLRTALLLQEDDRTLTFQSQESVSAENRKDRYLREIYLFTDLARTAWGRGESKLLKRELERLDWVRVYLIDVGVTNPQNVSVSSLTLSRQTVPSGGSFVVRAEINATGLPGEERTVDVAVQNDAGRLIKQGQSTVKLDDGGRVPFSVAALSEPMTQGEVRLNSSDPFAADDVRYFTVAVQPPPEILLIVDDRSEAVYWQDALAPAELIRAGKARFQLKVIRPNQLDETDLEQFSAICMINVRKPREQLWLALEAYVQAGGGLAVFLGHQQIDPVAYNVDSAQAILPGRLLAHIAMRPAENLDLRDLTHPILKKFDSLGGTGELSFVPIRRIWRIEPSDDATVIAPYTDYRQLPALLEKVHGNGRTVLLSTAVDLQKSKLEPKGWSDIPRARWSFVALADQMMQYLGQRAEQRYNYEAGQTVLLPIDRTDRPKRYLLRKPNLEQSPGDVPGEGDLLTLTDADHIGHYEVVAAAEEDSKYSTAFSVNLAPGESDFTRLNEPALDELLGEDRYRLARDIEELERGVGIERFGTEVFPLVLTIMIAAFCLEHVVANQFYDVQKDETAAN